MKVDGAPVPLTDAHRARFTRANHDMASLGERVLAFAQLVLDPAQVGGMVVPSDWHSVHQYSPDSTYVTDPSPNFPVNGMTLIGLVCNAFFLAPASIHSHSCFVSLLSRAAGVSPRPAARERSRGRTGLSPRGHPRCDGHGRPAHHCKG